MRWMTVKSIQKYSKTPEAALRTSIQHHRQILNASLEELRKGLLNGKVSVSHIYCGLCFHNQRYGANCSSCCLHSDGVLCCWEWWNLATVIEIFSDNPTKTNHTKVKRAERKLIKKIESLL